MISISPPESQSLSILRTTAVSAAFHHHHHHHHHHHRLPPFLPLSNPPPKLSRFSASRCFRRLARPRRSFAVAASATLMPDSVTPRSGVYTVGDFMTRKDDLYVVKPTTTVDEALEILVENRITGFPVIDDDWKLVGLVSDYDLLALDSISGGGRSDTSMFPEVDSTWKVRKSPRQFRSILSCLSMSQKHVHQDSKDLCT